MENKKILLIVFGIFLISFTFALILTSNPYGSTDINVTQEENFAHLSLSDPSLKLYMPFDYNHSSGIVYDYTNNSNDGEMINFADNYTKKGYIGGAYEFDGVDDYINLGDVLDIGLNDRTISVWFKWSSSKGTGTIIGKSSARSLVGRWSVFGNKGGGELKVLIQDLGGARETSLNGSFNDDKWHQLNIVYDRDENMTVYVDGKYNAQDDISGSVSLNMNTTDYLYLGSYQDSSGQSPYSNLYFFNGSIDEVIIYDRALSPTEILDLYNNQSLRFYPQGEMSFENLNFSGNDTVNITIDNYQSLKGASLQGKINSGDWKNFTKGSLNDYFISGDLTDSNFILKFLAGANNFYSPLIIGDLIFNSFDTIAPIIEAIFPVDSLSNENVTINTSITDGNTVSAWFDWENSLVGYWDFDFCNSSGCFDNSSYDNFGTFSGGLGLSDLGVGSRGNALDFDGVNDYINLGNAGSLNLGLNNFSICSWVKLNEKNKTAYMVHTGGYGVGYGFIYFRLDSNGKLVTGYMDRDSDSTHRYRVCTSDEDYSNFGWKFFCTVVNREENIGRPKLFVDGIEVSKSCIGTTGNASKINLSNSLNKSLGGAGSVSFFNGSIDEVMIFNRSLSSDEIKAIYDNSQYSLQNTFDNVSEGIHNYSIYAIDEAGNLNITSEQVEVDTTSPLISFGDLTPENDSGKSNEFELNVSIEEKNFGNIIYTWDGAESTFSKDGLVLMMSLDNDSSFGESNTHIYDFSGNGNNGTWSGDVDADSGPTNSGKYNGGFMFDGNEDYINFGKDVLLGKKDNFTYCGWFKKEGVNGLNNRSFLMGLSVQGVPGYRSYGVVDDAEGNLELYMGGSGSWDLGGKLLFNSWTYICLRMDQKVSSIFNNGIKYDLPYELFLPDSVPYKTYFGSAAISGKMYNFNGSIDEVRIYNRSLSPEEISFLYHSNLRKYDTDKWEFYMNQTGLDVGDSYTYFVSSVDKVGNSNSTEIRTIKGNSAPEVVSLVQTPTSSDDLDPNVTINIIANVSDTDNNFDSAILQWKNSTSSVWENETMINSTEKGLITTLEANFTPINEGVYYYRIISNDILGSSSNNSITEVDVYWDCTWTATSDLGAVAGWKENKEIGNIIINNTGDSEYADNNCSLSFQFTHDLDKGRVYFNNWEPNQYCYDYYYPSEVPAKSNLTIPINATFLDRIKQENVVIEIDELGGISETLIRNTTGILISNQEGPFLYQEITNFPNSVYLTPTNFSLNGLVQNVMGSFISNETFTAYNVTFNWVLPTGLTNSSGDLSKTFENITNNNLNYNNLNVSFSNLASMTPGIKTVSLYALGKDLEGNAISDANNNTLLTEQQNITFLCYSVPDGVYVVSCGTLDGDYVAPTTALPASSGGGGGATLKTEKVVSSADYQLVRGKQNEVKITFKNPDKNLSIENIKFSVTGDISKYIEVYPKSLKSLGPEKEINLTLKITSPTYIKLGTQKITILLTGKKGEKSYSESKKIVLEIHELTGKRAYELLNQSKKFIKQLDDANLSYDYLNDLLNSSEIKIKTFDYELVRDNYKIISEQVVTALKTQTMIFELDNLLNKSRKKGIDVKYSSRLIKLAKLSLKRREFAQANKRVKDAQTAYALEVKGKFGVLSYYLQTYPKDISFGFIFFFIFSFGSYKLVKLRYLKRRIKSLRQEEKLFSQLITVIQKECFEEKKMSMEEYKVAMEEYQQKLSQVIEKLIKYENKELYILRFVSKTKRLKKEREKVVKLVKSLQKDYLKNKKMETRSYNLRLQSYNKRFAEIDEEIATLEAKTAFKKGFKHKK